MLVRHICASVLAITALAAGAHPASAVTARLAFDAAAGGLNGGDGYKDADNLNATLAWGESYLMMGFVEMYRATGDPTYLVTLADHADAVLASRDDVVGWSDYAGVSGPCWQNTKYQPQAQPYCYVVHSGMISFPMVDFARVVYGDPGLHGVLALDGADLLAKADAYVAAAEATVAHHEPQWVAVSGTAEGFYQGDPGAAGFLSNIAGKELPINQMLALARTIVALWDATGDPWYLDRAQRLAKRFRGQLYLAPGGTAWVWNYWGGAYEAPGEDISHGAIEVDYAVLCHEAGIVFDDGDVARFGDTFFDNIYKDEDTLADQVGGDGSVNGSSYSPQIARWLDLAPWEPALWAVVRNRYEALGTNLGSGSAILGWALLARYEPVHIGHAFYWADWADQGDHQKATAYGANILVDPPAPLERAVIPVTYRTNKPVTVQQWDGAAYHDRARWPATGGAWRTLLLAYDPAIWFPYANGMVLYQFADTFSAGEGIEVAWSAPGAPPELALPEPPALHPGEPMALPLAATGADPMVWALLDGPPGASLDPITGVLAWTPEADGPWDAAFAVRVDNDWGSAAGALVVPVLPADGDGDGWPWDADCDDAQPHVSPDRVELCDGVDNDCDGQIDETCAVVTVAVFADDDGDGQWGDSEPGLAGVPVVLHRTQTDWTILPSDADGVADFGAVRPGEVVVRTRWALPDGAVATTETSWPVSLSAGDVLSLEVGFGPGGSDGP